MKRVTPEVARRNVTSVTKPSRESIIEQFSRDGEAASLHGMKIALALLSEAAKPGAINPLESIQDVSAAAKLARSIAGLDKPEAVAQVNLNLAGAFWSAPQAQGSTPAIELTPVVLEAGD